MTQSSDGYDKRQKHILDVAAELVQRQGYDKTTMSDIADAAGVSRGIVYLHFANKDAIFEALIQREFLRYAEAWLEYIESDAQAGTVGGLYRAVHYAINSNPLMAAIVKRDRQVFGNYLRKPDSPLAAMSSSTLRTEFIQALQEAGVVRKDVEPPIIAQLNDILSFGLLGMYGVEYVDNAAQFDDLIEVIADMLDRYLTPPDGADLAAGKAVIRQLANRSREQFEQMRQLAEDT
jgi:AcrR family transcriptional regulator